MRATILPYYSYYTNRGPLGLGQYNSQEVYCGLSSASKVFLIFSTLLYMFMQL